MARTKKPGNLVKRGKGYSLGMMVGGKRYMLAIRNPDTGETATSKTDAEKWRSHTADAIRAKATDTRPDFVPISKLEDAYWQFLPNYTKRKGEKHEDASKEARLAPRTVEANVRTLRTFVEYLQREHPRVKTSGDIGRVQAEGFMAAESHLKDSTYNRYLFSLRHVFNLLPYFSDNPFASLTARTPAEVKHETAGKERFTGEQLSVMQERATGWIRPAMFIGYYTGLRLGDVVSLRWDAIDGDYITLRIRKTGKETTIYAPEVMPHIEDWQGRRILDWNNAVSIRFIADILHTSTGTAWKVVNMAGGLPDPATGDDLAVWIHEACINAAPHCKAKAVQAVARAVPELSLAPIPEPFEKYVFPVQAARYLGIGRRADTTSATKQFQKFLCRDCAFETRNRDGQTILGFHSLRVTYATLHRIQSGDIESTQKQLQHSNARVTEGYDRRNKQERRRELAARHVSVPFPSTQTTLPEHTDPERDLLRRLADEAPIDTIRAMLAAARSSRALADDSA